MGGAPPPPQDFAPEGSKNRRNSGRLGPDFGGMRPRGSTSEEGGWGGFGHYPSRRGGVGPGPPTPPDEISQGGGSGNRPGMRSEQTGSISPEPRGIRQRHVQGPVRRWTWQRPGMGKRADCRTKSALHPARFAWAVRAVDMDMPSAYALGVMPSAMTSKQMRRRSRYVATSTLCLGASSDALHAQHAYAWEIDRCIGVNALALGQ